MVLSLNVCSHLNNIKNDRMVEYLRFCQVSSLTCFFIVSFSFKDCYCDDLRKPKLLVFNLGNFNNTFCCPYLYDGCNFYLLIDYEVSGSSNTNV